MYNSKLYLTVQHNLKMNTINLLTDVVLTVTGFQLVLLAVVLLKQQTKIKLSRNLLAAFLLAKAFLILRWFLFRWNFLANDNFPYTYFISMSVFFLLAPLLYFHIKSLCFKDFNFKISHLIHGMLFLFFIFFNFITVQIMLAQTVPENSIFYKIFINYHNRIFWGLNFIQIFLYIIAISKTVYVYKNKLKNSYSSIEKINLNWLVALLALIFLHWIFVVVRAMVSMLNTEAIYLTSIIDLYSISIFLVYTTILVFKGLNQLKIFSGLTNGQKYSNALLPEPVIKKYAHQLTRIMQTQKPYLEPSVTIEDLSEKLSIPSWQLSQVINYSFKQNFYNFINGYRVNEVRQKLKDPANSQKTILEILYDTGFNSKSTFNDVFKKYTGKTPTEFRNQN